MNIDPPRKKPTMNSPYSPVPQRPERDDQTWQRRRDPLAHDVILRLALAETRRDAR